MDIRVFGVRGDLLPLFSQKNCSNFLLLCFVLIFASNRLVWLLCDGFCGHISDGDLKRGPVVKFLSSNLVIRRSLGTWTTEDCSMVRLQYVRARKCAEARSELLVFLVVVY